MNGIQFYLQAARSTSRAGHMTFIDAPWALTALTQGQFWAERDFARDYGDGTRGRLPVGRHLRLGHAGDRSTASRRSSARASEVANEVLGADQGAPQRHGEDVLTDDMVHSWFLDPAIAWHAGAAAQPQRRRRCWSTRSARGRSARRRSTKIPNLFLAGDYVQTDIDLATMEGANESGRAAVNALLDASGSKAEPPRDVQALRPAGVRGAPSAADRELLHGRASRTRSTRRMSAAERVDAVVVGARCAGLGGGDRARARRAARGRARPRALPGRHALDAPAVRRAAWPSSQRARRARARAGARRAAAARRARWRGAGSTVRGALHAGRRDRLRAVRAPARARRRARRRPRARPAPRCARARA